MPPVANGPADPGIELMVARYGASYKWLVMIAGLLGSMSMVLSATMVNVAIPSIMGAYGVGQDLAQWAATAFLTTMVASQLLNAWMVGAFGQRIVFSFALAFFCAGSFIGSISPNIEILIFSVVAGEGLELPTFGL